MIFIPQKSEFNASFYLFRALEVIKPLVNEETSDVSNDTSTEDANSDLKSPISLVHEIALKRNFSVVFEVVSERGPPHMKTFVTKCKVGDIVVSAQPICIKLKSCFKLKPKFSD